MLKNTCVPEEAPEEGEYDVETEIVPDTREYLNEYLKEHYNDKLNEMNIIAVTGTNGKTTTAKLIHDDLADPSRSPVPRSAEKQTAQTRLTMHTDYEPE